MEANSQLTEGRV